MDALLKGAEVETVFGHDHDLAIQHDLGLSQPSEGWEQLGKVARHRASAAADQLDVVAVPEDEGAETVPFGLVLPAVALRNAGLRGGGKHRFHVLRDGQFHAGCPQVSISCGWRDTVLPYRRPVSRL